MNIPDIKIQLVHIDGPLKGEINEFCQPVVTLGRHPESEIVFPENCGAISREHAKIVREGNRFKLIDHSTNGTLVNGKQQKETFLQNGDVLIIGGKDGAKVSFLTQKIRPEEAAGFQKIVKVEEKQVHVQESAPLPTPVSQPEAVCPPLEQAMQQAQAQPVNKNLTIQHGAALNSFKTLPIIVGCGSDCDLSLKHSGLLDHHVQIFFQDNQYWIKDLTGRGLVTVNGLPADSGTVLAADARLKLSPDGPEFTFLGEGRLAEVEREVHQEVVSPGNPLKETAKDVSQESKPSLISSVSNKDGILWGVVITLGLGLVVAAFLIL